MEAGRTLSGQGANGIFSFDFEPNFGYRLVSELWLESGLSAGPPDNGYADEKGNSTARP